MRLSLLSIALIAAAIIDFSFAIPLGKALLSLGTIGSLLGSSQPKPKAKPVELPPGSNAINGESTYAAKPVGRR